MLTLIVSLFSAVSSNVVFSLLLFSIKGVSSVVKSIISLNELILKFSFSLSGTFLRIVLACLSALLVKSNALYTTSKNFSCKCTNMKYTLSTIGVLVPIFFTTIHS